MSLSRRPRTLPLGIDVGASRIRVALVHRTASGGSELFAVATRPHGDDPVTALADAVSELRTHERRCVFGLAEPRAILRAAAFPPMRRDERDRAARLEATRYIDYPVREAVVRVVSLGKDGEAVIGVVRKDVISSLVASAHAAKLRVAAVDNSAFAFRRAIPDADAVLDIGLTQSRLHILSGSVPIGHYFFGGGAALTAAIADSLGTDEITAERRKHTHGIAGNAGNAIELLVEDIANALVEFRTSGYGDVRSIALAGNGSRLHELPARIERATAVRVAPATLVPAISSTLPPDVLRAAAPDWTLAYGLALWGAA